MVHAGAAPLLLSERALRKLKGRKTKPATYNLDLNLIGDYWGWFGKRSYHHTGRLRAAQGGSWR
jgi:alanine-glyoxylate transaminase/serine-glyoxylate transaminase/serine-pyruvate transaminase